MKATRLLVAALVAFAVAACGDITTQPEFEAQDTRVDASLAGPNGSLAGPNGLH